MDVLTKTELFSSVAPPPIWRIPLLLTTRIHGGINQGYTKALHLQLRPCLPVVWVQSLSPKEVRDE